MDTFRRKILKSFLVVLLLIICIFAANIIDMIKETYNTLNISNNYNDEFSDIYLNEVFSLEEIHAKNIKNYKNKVIGFCLNKQSNESFLIIKEKLEKNNWTYVPSNNDSCASFSKKNGEYQWLFLACTQIDNNNTSVVITID